MGVSFQSTEGAYNGHAIRRSVTLSSVFSSSAIWSGAAYVVRGAVARRRNAGHCPSVTLLSCGERHRTSPAARLDSQPKADSYQSTCTPNLNSRPPKMVEGFSQLEPNLLFAVRTGASLNRL